MPLPAAFAPLAAPWAMKTAAAAATGLALWQAARRARWSQTRAETAEAALDAVPEGAEWGWSVDHDRQTARADARAAWRGTLRWGAAGPGFAYDLSGLARARLARLPARPSRNPSGEPRR